MSVHRSSGGNGHLNRKMISYEGRLAKPDKKQDTRRALRQAGYQEINQGGGKDASRNAQQSYWVYCISLSNKHLGKNWRLVKVGHTRYPKDGGKISRTEQLQNYYKRKTGKATETIFYAKTHATSRKNAIAIENKIRETIGYLLLDGDTAVKLGVHRSGRTEYGIIPTKYIDAIKKGTKGIEYVEEFRIMKCKKFGLVNNSLVKELAIPQFLAFKTHLLCTNPKYISTAKAGKSK